MSDPKEAEKQERAAAKEKAAAERAAARAAAKEQQAAQKAKKAEERAVAQQAKAQARQEVAESKKAAKAEAAAAESKQTTLEATIDPLAPDPTAAPATSPSAPKASPGFDESAQAATLEAEPTKEVAKKPKKSKKPKEPKASSKDTKSIRRAIRPIRSKNQQTTTRLIWAVFGMALIIVAIVGFWVVLENRDEEVSALRTVGELQEGDILSTENLQVASLKNPEGINYVPSDQLSAIVGLELKVNIAAENWVLWSMVGEVTREDGEVALETDDIPITFPLDLCGTVTMPSGGVIPGEDLLIFAVFETEGGPSSKFLLAAVTAAASAGGSAETVSEDGEETTTTESSGGGILLEGDYEFQESWIQELARYCREGSEGISWEIFRPNNPDVDIICWRERFKLLHGTTNGKFAGPTLTYDQYLGLFPLKQVQNEAGQIVNEVDEEKVGNPSYPCPLSWIAPPTQITPIEGSEDEGLSLADQLRNDELRLEEPPITEVQTSGESTTDFNSLLQSTQQGEGGEGGGGGLGIPAAPGGGGSSGGGPPAPPDLDLGF